MKTITLRQLPLILAALGVATVAGAQPTTMPAEGTTGRAPANTTTPATTPENNPAPNSSESQPNAAERLVNRLTAQQFVTDAAVGGREEVQLGRMAMERSPNPTVRNFGQRMVHDHSAADAKLAAIARSQGLELPSTNLFSVQDPNWNNPMLTGSQPTKDAYLLTTNMPLAQYQTIRHMGQLSGRAFDQEYAKDMVSDHIADIHEFEVAQRDLSNPALQQFAAQTLPTLRAHLQMAQKMENDVNNEPTAVNESNQGGAGRTMTAVGGM